MQNKDIINGNVIKNNNNVRHSERSEESLKRLPRSVQDDGTKTSYSPITLFPYSPKKKSAFTLAEVFSSSLKAHRKIAFTLAEVLITLGVIGIVAAITLPIFLEKYRKFVLVNQFKATYNLLLNGFGAMASDEGVTNLADTHAFSSIIRGGCGSDKRTHSYGNCPGMLEELQKRFGAELVIYDDYSYSKSLIDPNNKTQYNEFGFQMRNGAYMFKYYWHPVEGLKSTFYVDVNGKKAPNVMGRDIFGFAIIYTAPYVVPFGSKLCGEVTCTDFPYWKTVRGGCAKDFLGHSPIDFRFSHNCAGRIIEEGYKMNY